MMNSRFNLAILWLLALIAFSFSSLAQAGNPDADVVKVKAVNNGGSGWTFHVTVAHPDTGWDDYCNGWDVVTDKGEVLKKQASDQFTRLLFHPHETEQPFTRSQSGLQIDPSVESVTVRAHDIIDGFGGKEIIVNLKSRSGPGYTVTH